MNAQPPWTHPPAMIPTSHCWTLSPTNRTLIHHCCCKITTCRDISKPGWVSSVTSSAKLLNDALACMDVKRQLWRRSALNLGLPGNGSDRSSLRPSNVCGKYWNAEVFPWIPCSWRIELAAACSYPRHDQPGGDIAPVAHEEVIATTCGPGIHDLKTYSQSLDLRRYKRYWEMQLPTRAEDYNFRTQLYDLLNMLLRNISKTFSRRSEE